MESALLRVIVETARDPVAAFDHDLRHIIFNRAYGDHIRACARRPLRPGERLDTLLRQAGADPAVLARLRFALAGEAQDLEAVTLCGRGECRLENVRLQPVRGEDGAVVAVVLSGKENCCAIQAEDARTRLRLALRGAQAGAWERGIGGRSLDWSEEMHDLYGLAPGAFDGTVDAWLACVHPEDRPRMARQVDDLLEGEGPPAPGEFSYEFRIHHPQRGLRWMLSQGQVVRDHRGRPTALHGVTFDITGRKQAELEAREHADRLRLVLKSARAGLWERDLRTNRMLLSEEMYDLYGVPPEDYEPTLEFWYGLILPEYRDVVRRYLEEQMRQGASEVRASFPIHHPRRGRRWLEAQGQVEYDADGKPLRMRGITIDVTERRLAEEAARENGERLYLALKGAQAGSWEWDIAGDAVIWSDEVFDLIGQPPRRPMSLKQVLGTLHAEDREAVKAQIRTLLGGRREDFRVESRVVHPERGERWLAWIGQISYHPRHPGRPQFARGIAFDITERRAMEDSLRRARREAQFAKAEAERASLARSKFLAGASHDLRQPVQAMSLLTAVLAGRLRGHPAAALVAKLNQAQEGLRTMLNTLLDVSRLDAGAVTPEPSDFPVGPLIEDLAVEILVCAEDKGLRLHAVESGLWARSDPALVARILRNLLQNALRYTDRGGIVVGCRRKGDEVRIDVVDSGIGIAPEKQDAIFEEFVQSGPAEGGRQGLGLGLSIVRRLARLLGHRLEVESVPGRGSRFSLYLPRALPATVATVLPTPHSANMTAPCLVVALEDDELLRESLALMLESWGYEVVTAASSETALRRLAARGEKPDVVLADYVLAGRETGTEAIARLARRYGHLPSAIITGDTSPQRIVEALESGFEILHKPIAAGDLQQAVARLAAQRGDKQRRRTA